MMRMIPVPRRWRRLAFTSAASSGRIGFCGGAGRIERKLVYEETD